MTQKKLDLGLLLALPIGMLLFLNISSYDYVSPLYESVAGRVIMTFCLFTIGGAMLWGLRILDIDV